MLSFVNSAAKKASYVLIDMHDNFFSLLCIILLLNQKRARLRNVNTPPFMIKHASLHNADHGSRKQPTGLVEYLNYFDKYKSQWKAGK